MRGTGPGGAEGSMDYQPASAGSLALAFSLSIRPYAQFAVQLAHILRVLGDGGPPDRGPGQSWEGAFFKTHLPPEIFSSHSLSHQHATSSRPSGLISSTSPISATAVIPATPSLSSSSAHLSDETPAEGPLMSGDRT